MVSYDLGGSTVVVYNLREATLQLDVVVDSDSLGGAWQL